MTDEFYAIRCATVPSADDTGDDYEYTDEEEEDELPGVSPGEWGWCTPFCSSSASSSKSMRRTTALQEAQLSTLTSRQCAHYGKSMKAIPKIEVREKNVESLSYVTVGGGIIIIARFFAVVRGVEGGGGADAGDAT